MLFAVLLVWLASPGRFADWLFVLGVAVLIGIVTSAGVMRAQSLVDGAGFSFLPKKKKRFEDPPVYGEGSPEAWQHEKERYAERWSGERDRD